MRLFRRIYRNRHEQAFIEKVESYGWYVTKRGWPDFFCVSPGGEVIVVEVKDRIQTFAGKSSLKREQVIVLEALAKAGLTVRLFDASGKSSPFVPTGALDKLVGDLRFVLKSSSGGNDW